MRSPFHPRVAAHQGPGALRQAGNDRSVAEAFLGARHPLVRLLRQSETVREQVVAVAVAQVAGVVFVLGTHGFGLSLAVAGVLVQLGLGCRLAALRLCRRPMCLDLIVEGRGSLPLACVERECRRLLDPRTLGQLARSIEQIVEIAGRPVARRASARPLFEVRVIRPVVPELRQIASLLRGDSPSLAGVAAVERLLTDATPLYGPRVEPLRQELWRARYLLRASP